MRTTGAKIALTLALVFGTLLVAVAGLLFFAATRSDDFHVSRSITIAAAPERVFPHVNELKRWAAWSPWAKMDPQAVTTFEGPESGTGASMAWTGEKTGKGRMTIAESRTNEAIKFDLEFVEPFAATNTAEFRFTALDDQTTVNWSMSGKNNLIAKVVGLFMDCDKMVGGQFERGLADLKRIAEGESAAQ